MAQKAKNLPAMQETWVRSLGWEDSPGEENGYPLWYSGLENPMDRGTHWAIVHGVSKSQTRLRNFHFSCGADWAGVTQSNHFIDGQTRNRDADGHVGGHTAGEGWGLGWRHLH